MLQVVMCWMLSLGVLAGGALVVCGDDRCVVTELDRFGLSLAHALRSEPLDHLMMGVTWLEPLMLLLPLTGLRAWHLFRDGRRRESASSCWPC